MEETALQKLSNKVIEIVEKYQVLHQEVDRLREEAEVLKLASVQKDEEVNRLTEENGIKDLEIEEIVNKIESILG